MITDKKAQYIRKKFGAHIRELRTHRGLSQEAFAEACQLHRTYVGAVERGERNISIDNIAKIASALNMEIAELF